MYFASSLKKPLLFIALHKSPRKVTSQKTLVVHHYYYKEIVHVLKPHLCFMWDVWPWTAQTQKSFCFTLYESAGRYLVLYVHLLLHRYMYIDLNMRPALQT